MGRVPFRGSGSCSHSSGGREAGGRASRGRGHEISGRGRGRVANNRGGSRSYMPCGSGTILAVYQLCDTPETPESADSVGTSFPTNAPGIGTSVTSSAALSTALVAEAAEADVRGAESRAAEARANATAAAEIAAAAAAAQAATAAAQAAAAMAQAIEDANVADEYPNADKILISVIPGRIPRFQPSTATRMNKIFKLRVDIDGSNWTKVTPVMKNFYWEEFKKHFNWPRDADGSVKHCWDKAARKRYRDFINNRKNDAKKRDYIPVAVWDKWKADWNAPEALELSRKKRLARMGGVNGQCTKHTGGSITSSEHAIRFEVNNKRKPTCNELFELTHMRKDKSFIDEKSAATIATFNAKKLELSQSDESAPIPDDDAIFSEVVGGMNNQGSAYGLGSQSSSFVDNGSSPSASTSTLPQQITVSMLQNFIEVALTDFGFQNDENMSRRIGKAVESRMSPFESTLLEMQNLLATLTTNLEGGLDRNRAQNSGKAPTSDDDAENERLGDHDLDDLDD